MDSGGKWRRARSRWTSTTYRIKKWALIAAETTSSTLLREDVETRREKLRTLTYSKGLTTSSWSIVRIISTCSHPRTGKVSGKQTNPCFPPWKFKRKNNCSRRTFIKICRKMMGLMLNSYQLKLKQPRGALKWSMGMRLWSRAAWGVSIRTMVSMYRRSIWMRTRVFTSIRVCLSNMKRKQQSLTRRWSHLINAANFNRLTTCNCHPTRLSSHSMLVSTKQ